MNTGLIKIKHKQINQNYLSINIFLNFTFTSNLAIKILKEKIKKRIYN